MSTKVRQFVANWVASGLVDQQESQAFMQGLSVAPETAEQLAKELIRSGKLTKLQAQAIYRGKQKSLVLGSYVLLDSIGAGGMGQVYAAQHRRMKRRVAVKVLPGDRIKDRDAVARFHREVEAVARLSHPNIVTAYDAGESNGVHFLVMELVQGSDLSSVVRKHGPLPASQAAAHIAQTALGLQYAHQQGVIHRDIKPANLLLGSDGTVKILDMGLACLADTRGAAEQDLTGTGQIMGTLDYMAPEQSLSTKDADARSDIYSLGCTLYFLLTGKPPFAGTTLVEKFLAHRDQPIPSLSDQIKDLPVELDHIFARMIAKRPEDRYQDMGQVIAALEPIVVVGSAARSRAVAMAAASRGDSLGLSDRVPMPGTVAGGQAKPNGGADTSASQVLDDTLINLPKFTTAAATVGRRSKRSFSMVGLWAALGLLAMLGIAGLGWFAQTMSNLDSSSATNVGDRTEPSPAMQAESQRPQPGAPQADATAEDQPQERRQPTILRESTLPHDPAEASDTQSVSIPAVSGLSQDVVGGGDNEQTIERHVAGWLLDQRCSLNVFLRDTSGSSTTQQTLRPGMPLPTQDFSIYGVNFSTKPTLDDENVQLLHRLRRLNRLQFSQWLPDPDTLQKLSVASVWQLGFNTQGGRVDLKPLQRFVRLNELVFDHAPDQQDLELLLACQWLQDIRFKNRIEDPRHALQVLAQSRSIRTVCFRNAHDQLDDNFIRGVQENNPKLRVVVIDDDGTRCLGHDPTQQGTIALAAAGIDVIVRDYPLSAPPRPADSPELDSSHPFLVQEANLSDDSVIDEQVLGHLSTIQVLNMRIRRDTNVHPILQSISEQYGIQNLHVKVPQLDDQSLALLKTFSWLTLLHFYETKVTDAEVAQLRRALRHTRIRGDFGAYEPLEAETNTLVEPQSNTTMRFPQALPREVVDGDADASDDASKRIQVGSGPGMVSSLNEAFAQAVGGDVIEIATDEPLVIDQPIRWQKPGTLTLRAADGFHPILVAGHSENHALLSFPHSEQPGEAGENHVQLRGLVLVDPIDREVPRYLIHTSRPASLTAVTGLTRSNRCFQAHDSEKVSIDHCYFWRSAGNCNDHWPLLVFQRLANVAINNCLFAGDGGLFAQGRENSAAHLLCRGSSFVSTRHAWQLKESHPVTLHHEANLHVNVKSVMAYPIKNDPGSPVAHPGMLETLLDPYRGIQNGYFRCEEMTASAGIHASPMVEWQMLTNDGERNPLFIDPLFLNPQVPPLAKTQLLPPAAFDLRSNSPIRRKKIGCDVRQLPQLPSRVYEFFPDELQPDTRLRGVK